MDRRSFLKKSLFGAGVLISGCSKDYSLFENRKKKLNFVFFLIDDLGWRDLGCYGSTFYETPNIDKLAGEGMRFTQAYAASPVCSPTRASILTGKHPARLGITQWIAAPMEPTPFNLQMPLEEITLAEAFKEAGYATGFIGKWHLCTDEKFYPTKQGFDINIGGYRGGTPKTYFSPYDIPTMKDGPDGEYLTDRLTDEAVKFIEKNRAEPFLLYLSHYAVHTPVEAKKEMVAKYEAKAKQLSNEKESYDIEDGYQTQLVQNNADYAVMVESVDESVGRITQELKKRGIDKDTAIIFMSDNGGVGTYHKSYGEVPTSNMPLREGKGWLYEGGIREPMIIKWPGVTMAGSVCDVPVISMDFYPTMLEMAGLELKPKQHIDGISLVGLLKGAKSIDRDVLYWHYPHFNVFGNFPCGAIRVDDYKLIEYYENNRIELYNLKNDIGEREDLSQKEPAKAAELQRMLHERLKAVNANMPTREGFEKAWEKIEKGTFLPWMRQRKRKSR